jgi:hypothetical protein
MMKSPHHLKTLATNHKVTWHHVQEKGDLKCITAKAKSSVGNFVLQRPLLTLSKPKVPVSSLNAHTM